jgi:hypothetical protein
MDRRSRSPGRGTPRSGRSRSRSRSLTRTPGRRPSYQDRHSWDRSPCRSHPRDLDSRDRNGIPYSPATSGRRPSSWRTSREDPRQTNHRDHHSIADRGRQRSTNRPRRHRDLATSLRAPTLSSAAVVAMIVPRPRVVPFMQTRDKTRTRRPGCVLGRQQVPSWLPPTPPPNSPPPPPPGWTPARHAGTTHSCDGVIHPLTSAPTPAAQTERALVPEKTAAADILQRAEVGLIQLPPPTLAEGELASHGPAPGVATATSTTPAPPSSQAPPTPGMAPAGPRVPQSKVLPATVKVARGLAHDRTRPPLADSTRPAQEGSAPCVPRSWS